MDDPFWKILGVCFGLVFMAVMCHRCEREGRCVEYKVDPERYTCWGYGFNFSCKHPKTCVRWGQ